MNQPYLGQNPGYSAPAIPGYANVQGSLGSQYQGLGYNAWGDPFGYTNQSLLTPWSMDLPEMPDYGGGGSPIFSFGNFSYGGPTRARDVTAERVTLPTDFVAPTLDETNDPGYAFRLAEAERSILNNASAQGVRGGDVAKALNEYAQNYASSEYDKVWNRAFGSHNANFQNRFTAEQANQVAALQAGLGNQQADIAGNALGWQVASGSWDRNFQNAQLQHQSAASAAAAGAAANQQRYNEEMRRYGLAYDMFQNNQTNQFNRLYSMAQMGQGAANNMTNAAAAYGQNYMNSYGAGQAAGAQAWGSAADAIGQGAGTGIILASPWNPFSNYNAGA